MSDNRTRRTRIFTTSILLVVFSCLVAGLGGVNFSPIPPGQLSCTQDQICVYDFNATKTGPGTLNFSLDTAPFAQHINGATGVMNFTPGNDDVGIYYSVVAIAKELPSGGIDIAIINWTILNTNDPPYITSYYPLSLSLTIPENQTLYFNISADDPDIPYGDSINYTWLQDGTLNKTLLNSTTYEANYTPDFQSAGIHIIRVNVQDNQSATAYINWTVNVTDVNRPCYRNGTIPNITMVEDTAIYDNFTLYQYFRDPDLDNYPLNFTASSNPNITVQINKSRNNNVSIIPKPNYFGKTTLQFRCFDGYQYSSWSNIVVINVTGVQDPPNITNPGPKTAYVDALFALQIQANDVDFDTLTYYDNTSLFNINPTTGLISFTPTVPQINNYSINITVGDGTYNATIVFNLSIVNNSAPVLAPIGNQTATEGAPFLLYINATDPDVIETLTFDYICNNCTGTVNPNLFSVTTLNSTPTNGTGRIGFTPTNSDVGDWSVTYHVNDSRGASDSETITISIQNINFNPVLQFIPDQTIKVNLSFNLTAYATDPDGDIIGFTDNTTLFNISNVTIGANATGFIKFTPNETGNYSVLITVWDSTGQSDSQAVHFEITLNRPPELPYIGNYTTTEDNATTIQITATDPDPQDLPFLRYFDNTTLFNIGFTTGLISFTPNASQVGEYSINITVTDGEYNDSKVMNLTVLFYDDFPYWDPSLTQYYVNESNYLNTSTWDATKFSPNPTNRTLWNSSIWQNNQTIIYMDAYDEESTNLVFNATFLSYTNASNDTITTGITRPFNITNYDGNTALVNFTPNNSQVGTYSVNFSVYDNTSRTIYTIIELIVHNINDAPVVLGYSPAQYQNMNENTTMAFSVNATDIDYGDSVNYKWYYEGQPIAGATQKNYSFYADFLSSGNRTLAVELYDNYNESTIHTWYLNITNVNRPGHFGKIITKSYDEFNAGTSTNMTTEQINRETTKLLLAKPGAQYYPSGTYESEVLDSKESNYFHNFTTIEWAGNTSTNSTNVTFNVYFQTRTSQALNGGCPATINVPYSTRLMTSGSTIPSELEQCIQYKATVFTNDTDYTPYISTVDVNYIIADYTQEQATTRNWVFLRDYFSDPDTDDYLTYDVTGPNRTAMNTGEINITISNQTRQVTVISNSNFIGDVYVQFHMSDGENNVSSNVVKITITEIPPIQTPIIIPVGGGGATVQQPIEVEVPQYIATPVAFRLVAPGMVTTYANDTVEIPLNIFNEGNYTLEDIELSAETENEYVELSLSKTKIAMMEPGKKEFLTLTAKAFRRYSSYVIDVIAKGDAASPTETGGEIRTRFTERTRVFVSSLLKAEGNESQVNTKLSFAQDLLSSNPECLELNEFVERARKLLEEGKEKDAHVLLDKIIESCKYLVAPKEKLPELEAPSEALRIPKESLYVLATVAALTFIIAIALVIGWAHMRRRGREYMRPGTK